MNISKPLVLCFLATAWIFAQAPAPTQVQTQAPIQFQVPVAAEPITQIPLEEDSPEMVVLPPTPPSSSSAAETKPIPQGKAIFDSAVRGHAYNPYSTVGAASTVVDLVRIPSYIFGQKFFYVAPGTGSKVGGTAFDFSGGSALLGLSNQGNLSALVLGYATPGLGLSLKYSVDKEFTSNDKTNVSTRTTYPNDNIGLNLSLPLGTETLYANGGWLTYRQSESMDDDGKTSKIDYSSIICNAGLLGSNGSLNYDMHFNFSRYGGSYVNPDDKKAVEVGTYSRFAGGIDLGYAALQSQNARVIVGLNNSVGVAFYDKIGTLYKGANVISVQLVPNILGDVAITENFFVFAGATNGMRFKFGGPDLYSYPGVPDDESDTHYTEIKSISGTLAFMGIRYQKASWAIESEVLDADPFAALGGKNILFNVGGFIYF